MKSTSNTTPIYCCEKLLAVTITKAKVLCPICGEWSNGKESTPPSGDQMESIPASKKQIRLQQ